MNQESVPLLQLKNITKTFPGGVVANDEISISVERGEIHGLLGENGAGKTTLMKTLYGMYSPDNGEILLNGEPADIDSPATAIETGIGMVHQHFMLIPRLSVTQNIVLGLWEPTGSNEESPSIAEETGPFQWLVRLFTNNYQTAEDKIEALSDTYDFGIDPSEKVWELDVGEQQRVEILKTLYRDVDLLILDEPTAVLTPAEVEQLFTVLRSLVAEGLPIIFITHKLEEATEITDRITVLRDGSVVDTVETETVSQSDLARMMVGREVLFEVEKTTAQPGEEVLTCSDLRAEDDRGVMAVKNVDMRLREGEIVGLAGVSGNGQRELVECLIGLREAVGGQIQIAGNDFTGRSPREFIEAGVSYIPEDRMEFGVVGEMSVMENLLLKNIGEFKHRLSIDYGSAREYAQTLVEDYDIRIPDLDSPVNQLSGGNIQKLIVARELARNPDVLVAHQPTRGVDVGAIEYIQQRLLEQRTEGTGVLLISEKLDEVIQLSDRILVMYEGETVYEVDAANVDRSVISEYMTGQETDSETGSAVEAESLQS